MLTATELAKRLGLSKGRISQLVGDGRLDGCYSGDGRARRFDLDQVQQALSGGLDFGQMMGNGAKTREALRRISDEDDVPDQIRAPRPPRDGAELPASDAGRYELARALKAEEEARALRRRNLEAEGQYVLASEVSRQVQRLLSQEIAEVESFIRSGARDVADRLGVDFKMVRKILLDGWRSHRAGRHDDLATRADAAAMSDSERAEDI